MMSHLTKFKFLLLMLCFFLLNCQDRRNVPTLSWQNKQQLLLVIAKGWHTNAGILWRFQYRHHQWYLIGHSIDVSLGSRGLAWGKGLHPEPQKGPYKQEGDKRSPVGIFRIGSAFGYRQFPLTKMPFHVMGQYDFCIDDARSSYYNQIINRQELNNSKLMSSSEPMRRDLYFHGDQLYKLGFIIEHNKENIPALGSCIFAHLRMNHDAVTAGCTSMDEEDMQTILSWLDPALKPVLILLPISVYKEKSQQWHLPEIKFIN